MQLIFHTEGITLVLFPSGLLLTLKKKKVFVVNVRNPQCVWGQRSFILFFHQSKQLIFALPQLICVPATLALPRERGITRLSPRCASCLHILQLSSPWLNRRGGCRLDYSICSISLKSVFICTVLSLLLRCGFFTISGSHSVLLSLLHHLHQLWHWFAIVVIWTKNSVQAHLLKWLLRACLLLCTCSVCDCLLEWLAGDFEVVALLTNRQSHWCYNV